MDNRVLELRRRKALLENITRVRALYWRLYGNEVLWAVRQRQVTYFQRRLSSTRTQFELGLVAEMDTLASKLEVLRAQESLRSEETRRQARQGTRNGIESGYRTAAIARRDGISPHGTSRSRYSVATGKNIDRVTGVPRRRNCNCCIRVIAIDSFHKSILVLPIPGPALEPVWEQTIGASPRNVLVSLIFSYTLPDRANRIESQKRTVSREVNTIQENRYRVELEGRIEELALHLAFRSISPSR